MPWTTSTRSPEEWEAADRRVSAAKQHLRILLHELEQTLSRIEDKRRRGLHGD